MRKLTMGPLKVIIYLLTSLLMTKETSGSFCAPHPELCSECKIFAICKTSDKDTVIPQDLPSSVQHLKVFYIGTESVRLRSSMFDVYSGVTSVTLSGLLIHSIEQGTFSKLTNLQKLIITGTSIKEIPDNILAPTSQIVYLDLASNFLTSVPYHLFDDLPQLTNLYLGFNKIIADNCSTIGSKFSRLENLTILDLSNFKVRSECETEIPRSFFKPIQSSVRYLNLTIANIYSGSQMIFKNFSCLKTLDISLAKNFVQCPSNATELFNNLPPTLENLILRRWRTDLKMGPECATSNETLFGLKVLPRLVKLDMRYGDLMFTEKLAESVFSGFNLSELNIGYARISSVEEYAFERCPNLSLLNMDGNPVGSRPMRLFRERTASQLKYLSLEQSFIYSDYGDRYDAAQLLVDAPLEQLNLRSNYISKMPFFISNETVSKGLDSIKIINLDNNALEDLQSGGNLSEQCKFLSKLKVLTISNNRLQQVQGLCPSIRILSLSYNQLSLFWEKTNQDVISNLHYLEYLDLSYNSIRSFSSTTFTNMPNLTWLYLAGSNFSSFDSTIFAYNVHLVLLDLQHSSLLGFNASAVEHLRKLEYLYLEDNGITRIDEQLIPYLDNSSVVLFGIAGNPLLCTCTQNFFQVWIRQTDIVPYANQLECSGPTETLRFQKVYNYERDDFYCDYREAVIAIVTVLGGIIGAVLIAIPCYKYRWYVSHARVVTRAIINNLSDVKFEQRCLYDAYVMYNSSSDDDLTWVVQDLRLAIEDASTHNKDEKPLKLYIHDRDALPGSTVYTEMISAMEKSRKIIIVLSNSYLKKPQCKGQADLAGRESYGRKVYQPNRIMVVIRERLDEDAIEAPFTSLLTENILDISNCSERTTRRAWLRIRNFISKPRYEYLRKKANRDKNSRDFTAIAEDEEMTTPI